MFIFSVLTKNGFDDNDISWIKIISHKWWTYNLYTVHLKILFILIKNDPNNKGLEIFDWCYLYTTYADDTTFFLKRRKFHFLYFWKIQIIFYIFRIRPLCTPTCPGGPGYDDIVCEFALLCVLLTYLIESWISPGCSYEFNVVYMQREISICYTKTTYEGHTFKNENKRKSLRYIFVYLFLFCICLFVAKNLSKHALTTYHMMRTQWAH